MDWILDYSKYIPRMHCSLDGEMELWIAIIYIVSSIVIALSYLTIASTLFLIRKKISTQTGKVTFLLFSSFIGACGLTHLLDAFMFYFPHYRLMTLFLSITAAVSFITSIRMPFLTQRIYSHGKDKSQGNKRDGVRRLEDFIHYMSVMSSNIKESPTPKAILDSDFNYIMVSESWLNFFEIDGSLSGKSHNDKKFCRNWIVEGKRSIEESVNVYGSESFNGKEFKYTIRPTIKNGEVISLNIDIAIP